MITQAGRAPEPQCIDGGCHIVNPHDVRVLQRGGGTSFSQKHRPSVFIPIRKMWQLECDDAFQSLIFGSPNDSKLPLAHDLQQFVVAECAMSPTRTGIRLV